jgi:signal transduction histidine kinase/ActR/RegA family two-component response regulator
VAAGVAIGLGSAALLGWQLNAALLKSVVPGLVAMNPLTAVCFILAGVALWALSARADSLKRRALGRLLAGIVACAGGIKLAGLLLGFDPGIDRLLFASKLGAMGALPPNRMAPNTAFNFLLLGLALLMSSREAKRGRNLSDSFALPVLLLSVTALVGYAYHVRAFYGLTSFIPMALNTAVAFLALSIGILLTRPDRGLARVFTSEDLGGMVARRLLPFSVGALLLMGWLRLHGEQLGLYGTDLGAALNVVVSSLVIGWVIWISAERLSRADSDRKHALEDLRRAHDELEARVQQRTAELRRSEEQLRQAQKMEAIGGLAGGVAHDFNNMLTAILGYSQLARMHIAREHPSFSGLEEIEKAGHRAASLTRQLLAFSRQQVLQPRVLDLSVLVGEMDKMLRRLIGADVELLTAPETSLGRVKADPGQIEQVLMNLVVNARDAMPGGGKITIETANVELDESYTRQHSEVAAGPYVLLAVSDTGSGMDAATKARIFEPFFTTKGLGKGTGLGLSTVYGIVRQSGGHVEVYSEMGRGTAFKVYLPRVADAPELREVETPKAALPRGTETVLVVEDEDLVRGIIVKSLEIQGYRVIGAQDGLQGLELLQSVSVDLLVTDVRLPRMAGPELVRQALVSYPGLRVLYISGYTDKAVLHHGILSAGSLYIQKPFTPDALARKVREALGGPGAMAA